MTYEQEQILMQSIVNDINAGKFDELNDVHCVSAQIDDNGRSITVANVNDLTATIRVEDIAQQSIELTIAELADEIERKESFIRMAESAYYDND